MIDKFVISACPFILSFVIVKSALAFAVKLLE